MVPMCHRPTVGEITEALGVSMGVQHCASVILRSHQSQHAVLETVWKSATEVALFHPALLKVGDHIADDHGHVGEDLCQAVNAYATG